LGDRLSVGGLILFDEYGFDDWPGETKAADEFLAENDMFSVIEVGAAEQPSLVIQKHG